MKLIATTSILLVRLSLQPCALFADTNSKPVVCRMEWQILSGRVQQMDVQSRRIDLVDRDGNLAHIIVDQDVQIFRHWRLVNLNDLKDNDRVMLRRGDMRY